LFALELTHELVSHLAEIVKLAKTVQKVSPDFRSFDLGVNFGKWLNITGPADITAGPKDTDDILFAESLPDLTWYKDADDIDIREMKVWPDGNIQFLYYDKDGYEIYTSLVPILKMLEALGMPTCPDVEDKILQTYLADPFSCPSCKSGNLLTNDKLEAESPRRGYQDIICRNCGASWTDEYELVGLSGFTTGQDKDVENA
jgi:hypothetical protein